MENEIVDCDNVVMSTTHNGVQIDVEQRLFGNDTLYKGWLSREGLPRFAGTEWGDDMNTVMGDAKSMT